MIIRNLKIECKILVTQPLKEQVYCLFINFYKIYHNNHNVSEKNLNGILDLLNMRKGEIQRTVNPLRKEKLHFHQQASSKTMTSSVFDQSR